VRRREFIALLSGAVGSPLDALAPAGEQSVADGITATVG